MQPRAKELRIIPLSMPDEIHPGDSLLAKIADSLRRNHQSLRAGDILVIKHKIVSKAEGRLVPLEKVRPSAASRVWGKRFGLDARVTELALHEARRVVRRKNGVLITETRHGLVCANSGVDTSNVDGGRHALLLPKDSDLSAARLHRSLKKHFNLYVPVIISDTFGRPWREGLTEVAIGIAGMQPMHDFRGQDDPHGYKLRVSLDAVADELACAAGLVCGKLSRTPACIIRNFLYQPGNGKARDLVRPAGKDLFR